MECQNTGEVERRVQSLLGHTVDFGAVPPTRVHLGWSAERGWAVRVTVELRGGPRDRSLDAPSCADAFDVIALSLALILDPDFGGVEEARADGDSTATPAEEPPDSPAPPPAPSVLSGSGSHAAAFEGVTEADAPGARDGALLASEESPPTRFSIGAAALADPWTLPAPQFGAGLSAALGSGAVRVEVEGDVLSSRSGALAGARYPMSFTSVLGALRGCYAAQVTARLGWLACAGAELGSLGTREHGGEERRARGLWLAAQALTGPELAITDWLWAFARARAVTPLRRHELFLSEGSRVHELPWLSLQMQVGVTVAVTELDGGGH